MHCKALWQCWKCGYADKRERQAASGLVVPGQRTQVPTHAQEGLSKASTAVNDGAGKETPVRRVARVRVCDWVGVCC